MKLFKNDAQNNDLTSGALLPKIIKFVLPLIITNLLQVFYSAADMIVVSLSDAEGAIGAIGTTGAMINLILNIFIGLSIGANVIVARYIGMGSRDATSKAVHTSLILSVICGAVALTVGLFISRPVLAFMGDEGHILDLAVKYTSIYFVGVPFLSAANFLIAIFRAKGDTKTPLIVLTASGLLNVVLNLFFVVVLKMDVDGVAYATAISNAVSAIVLLIILSKDKGWVKFEWKKLKIDKRALVDIVKVGVPAGVQGAVFSLSNMLIQSSIISLNNAACPGGSAIIDGNAAASSLEGFAYTATNSVYQAAVTFVSQHYGAMKLKRIGKVMKCCYLVTFVIATVVSLTIVFLRRPLLALYGVSEALSELSFSTAQSRLFILLIPYFTLAFMETGSGTLRGLGKSLTSTIVSLLGSCVLRIVWIYTVFRVYNTIEVVYLSYPISWALTGLVHFICTMATRRKLARQYPEAATAE